MRVITEVELRELYKQAEFTSFQLPADTRLTPAAAQFISERRISLTQEGQTPAVSKQKTGQPLAGQPGGDKNQVGQQFRPSGREGQLGFTVLESGEKVAEKPEFMTHLRGTTLVPKNHAIIRFRGKLDSMEAYIISAIMEVQAAGYSELVRDLGDILEYCRDIMRAEVRNQPLEPLGFHGLTTAEIRERSHYPSKFYGVDHIIPSPAMGRLMCQLNILRVQSRELEVAAMDAFQGSEAQESRLDILQALNRLSSLIYVLMLQLTAGQYKVGC